VKEKGDIQPLLLPLLFLLHFGFYFILVFTSFWFLLRFFTLFPEKA